MGETLQMPDMWRMADCIPRATNRLMLDPMVADAGAILTRARCKVIMGFDQPGAGGSAIHEMGGARRGQRTPSPICSSATARR